MNTSTPGSLTPEGRKIVDDVAQRHGVSSDTVLTLLMAISQTGGGQAQFNIGELGGMGQWSQGGMTMVGDMFNNGLKARVDSLCSELSSIVRSNSTFQQPSSFQSQSQGGSSSHNSYNTSGHVSLFVPGGSSTNWWPGELGHAASVGSQNDLRYAYFPQTRRLAINHAGKVTVHDSGDHQIGGFSQQQSGDQSLTFTSQHGLVRVSDLPVVDGAKAAAATASVVEDIPPPSSAPYQPAAEQREAAPKPATSAAFTPTQSGASSSEDDIFAKIERLADLHKKGVLTQAEFDSKKAELLARI